MPRIRYINRNVSPELLYDRFEIQIQYIFELAARERNPVQTVIGQD